MSSEGTIATHFSDLDDKRRGQGKRHHLLDVITIAICAIIAGAEGWTDMELFGQTKEEWFRGFLELPHGIPSDDTFRRVFEVIDPVKFQQRFMNWVQTISDLTAGEVIAIDGKAVRGTYQKDRKKRAVHMVSAWATNNKLVLGQRKVAEKSNEITAIPELLELLTISGCIVTIDAMGCQTEIAEQIVQQEGDYLLAVKKNQEHLYEDIEWLFELATDANYAGKGFDTSRTVNKDHGRLETRRCWLISDAEWLSYIRDRHRWPHLKAIVKVEANRQVDSHKKPEVRYYIASFSGSAKQVLAATRSHWGIENEVHWVLDVIFNEDGTRIRDANSSQNLVLLRHMALNLLRQDKSTKLSLRAKRLKATWDHLYLRKVLSG
jgi:predicted transposase YbfD/YdcC